MRLVPLELHITRLVPLGLHLTRLVPLGINITRLFTIITFAIGICMSHNPWHSMLTFTRDMLVSISRFSIFGTIIPRCSFCMHICIRCWFTLFHFIDTVHVSLYTCNLYTIRFHIYRQHTAYVVLHTHVCISQSRVHWPTTLTSSDVFKFLFSHSITKHLCWAVATVAILKCLFNQLVTTRCFYC